MISTLKLHSVRFASNPENVKFALLTLAAISILAGALFPEIALAEGGTGSGHTGG